jgi:hypothetical protein
MLLPMPAKLQNRYITPVYFLGARVICEVRGPVTIVGLSDGLIRWPIGLSDGQTELIVYRGLAKAVREELAAAVAAHWKVPVAKLTAWRLELDKPPPVKQPRPGKQPQPIRRRRRVGRPPITHVWTPEEDEIVRSLPQGEAARKLGVSTDLIRRRRIRIGVGLHDLLRRS